jgi:biopolymer transport protein ExbD
MMKMSRRARRMERHHQRRKDSGLNLVSLMDIFTILVFFLLVSSSSVQQLPSSKDIKLPTSIARKAPEETLVIAVTSRHILVQGRKVAQTAEVLASNEDLIPALVEELKFQASKMSFAVQDKSKGRAVTILGDEALPYALLRKILATCRQANYTRIAFAANQKTREKV